MSSLNAEYNVMSGVVTHDIYKRLFNKDATDKQMLRVARWSTLIIGIVMTGGAILIQGIGGAFEANKLFTGILAIPLGVPLILGIVAKRPGGAAAMLTIIAGVSFGTIVNLIPAISWELGTMLEMIFCLVIYFFLYKERRSETKQREVSEFFKKLSSPIPESEKPVISPQYKKVLVSLFAFSFAVAGFLFCGLSIPSISTRGGLYSFIAGALCLAAAAGIVLFTRKFNKTSKI